MNTTGESNQTEQRTAHSCAARNSFSTGGCTALQGSAHLNTCLGASFLFYLRKSLQLQSHKYLSARCNEPVAATARSETCPKHGLGTNRRHLVPGWRPTLSAPQPGHPLRAAGSALERPPGSDAGPGARTGSAFGPGNRFFLIFSVLPVLLPHGLASPGAS